MAYWLLKDRTRREFSPDGEATKPDLAVYAQADTADEALTKFESLCGHLPAKDFEALEVQQTDIPEDETVL